MFGFGWVRTHLGVVFYDAFVVFEVFGWISGKMDEMSKTLASSRVLRHGVVTLHSNVGPRQGVACPRRRATPRRSTVHSMENFCVVFCFAIPLFQGLVYWTNKDPISV